MKIATLSLILLLSLIGIYIIPTHLLSYAQQNPDEVYIDVEPPNYSFINESGETEKVRVQVRSNLKELVTYGFDWNKRAKELDFNFSSWIKLPSRKLLLGPNKEATHSFNLVVPNDTQPGEYYKLVTYSNKPYSCEESNAPPLMVGVPINNLIIKGAPAGERPSSLEELKQLLHAHIRVTSFQSFFSLLNQSQNFRFTVTNDGNLEAYFSGYILVKNQAGETVEKIDFDNGVHPLAGNERVEISLAFEKSKQLTGMYQSELYISYKDSLQEFPMQKVDTINFTFIGAYIILDFTRAYGVSVLVFLLIRQLVYALFKPHYKLNHSFILMLIIAIIPASALSFVGFMKSPQVQGTVKSGDETVTVSAKVRQSTAFSVRNVDERLVVKIRSQNSRNGWELWSFNCSSTRLLATDQTFKDQIEPEFTLDEQASRLPILLITRFFSNPQ